MALKNILTTTLVSGVVAVGSVWGFSKFQDSQLSTIAAPEYSYAKQAKYEFNGETVPMVDFEKAATKASPAVVHIRTTMKAKTQSADLSQIPPQFREFFGPGFGDNGRGAIPQRASGSGVFISPDGYIVTNNHVVDGATEVQVTLSNRKDYKAKVVGTDPSTDLAVVKVDGKDFPFIKFSNSDDVHLGQWVLAIGYPLNLETTVTSGIVSAKARNIGINSRKSNSAIESFIQTDAAVNPGNSGGALVNTDGDLIGINSAIASPTGSYAGYSYAIPSNLVQRVVTDIIKFGSAKRAYLGIMFPNDQLSGDERAKNNIKEGDGVYVIDVARGSTAAEAGIEKGDFITKLNGTTMNSGTELMGKVGSMRPGDQIEITYIHNGSEKTVRATLKGDAGEYASVKSQVIEQLGASFEALPADQAARLGIRSGVVVKQLGQGLLTDQTRMRDGFIITKVNDQRVGTVDELRAALRSAGNTTIISGIYPGNPNEEYQYALNDLNG